MAETLMCTAGCGVPVYAEWSARTGRTAHPQCGKPRRARRGRVPLDPIEAGVQRVLRERAAFLADVRASR